MSNERLRLTGLWLVLALALTSAAAAQDIKPTRIKGYVVEMVSPTEFTLEDDRITEDRTYRVILDRGPGVDEAIGIGAHLEMEATFDATANQFRASTFKRHQTPEDHTPSTTTISSAVAIERGERSYWDSLRIRVKEPVFDRRRSGGVTIQLNTHYEIIANAEVQEYIAALGRRLVPPFQRDLADDDPLKIPFKFYVVRQADQVGASALPNGIVLMYSRTFEVMQNEAQVASVLAHEIAHVVQKHLWKLWRMPPSSIKTVYNRAFENQSDRLGLGYMVDAGYDPREATRTWRLMANKLGFTPLRGSHENYAMRRAFMMHELATAYLKLDYSVMTRGEEEFKRIAALVKKPY